MVFFVAHPLKMTHCFTIVDEMEQRGAAAAYSRMRVSFAIRTNENVESFSVCVNRTFFLLLEKAARIN